MSFFLSLWTLSLVFLKDHVQSCDITTHIEIGHRALQTFQGQSKRHNINYEELMRKHQDAFQAGNPYPDAMYPDICFSGNYHSVAEDTHWAPFMNASINYIRKHYPPPWDEDTEKLVVFILGLASHQVADVSWHSLGIEQGFLSTMGNVNFHGSYSTAHPIGDFVGDVLTYYELKLPYIGEIKEWYVPIEDLKNIYQEYYGQKKVPVDVIALCSSFLYLGRLAEDLAVAELYIDFAGKSPYLVDKFEDYFLGGLDDMAAGTQNYWQRAILMLEEGTSACNIPHNPLFITCNETQERKAMRGDRTTNGYYIKPFLKGVDRSSIQITKTKRGINFRPSEKYLKRLREKKLRSAQRKLSNVKTTNIGAIYSFGSEYSKLGWSLASGDVNHDGNSDLIIGSPGWGINGSIQQGRVYIIYGEANGLPTNTSGKVQTINGQFRGQSKFGSSVAVVDINLDGISDVVVGAPSFTQDKTYYDYKGMVYIYFGSTAGPSTKPNITISCQDRYCNWGWSLAAGDINMDSYPDLLIGSPFAPGDGEQRGLVAGLFSNHNYNSHDVIQLQAADLDWIMMGDQDYGWLGSSIIIKNSWIVIGQPVYRICVEKNCSYSQADKQSVGKIHVLKASTKGPVLMNTLIGSEEFEQFGTALSIGRPHDNYTDILAVSSVTSSVEWKGFKLPQVGQVYLYNLTEMSKQPLSEPITTFSGNRVFSRFGAAVEFSDLSGSGYDDLIISSPLYAEDMTELFPDEADEGQVYIFHGGPHFVKGNATYGCHGITEPCPSEKAGLTLSFNNHEKKARFGSTLAVVQSNGERSLAMSAVHSSFKSVHMQGAVGIYTVKNAS